MELTRRELKLLLFAFKVKGMEWGLQEDEKVLISKLEDELDYNNMNTRTLKELEFTKD
ncbi:MAG: hypothetical protein ACRCTZ_16515 [Sarcina sp.]